MGNCVSKKNKMKKILLLPELNEKFKTSLLKSNKSINKSLKPSKKKSNCFLNIKGFIGLNPNPLIKEYR